MEIAWCDIIIGVSYTLKHIVILTQTLYPRNSMKIHCREVISMAGLVGDGLPLLMQPVIKDQ